MLEAQKTESPQKPLVRALQLEMVKPVAFIDRRGKEHPVSWDDVGPILRALRDVANRLINSAVLGAIHTDNTNRTLPPGDPRRKAPHTATYQAVEPEFELCRQWAQQELDKVKRGQDERIADRQKKLAALEGLSKGSTKRRANLEKEIAALNTSIEKAGWDLQRYTSRANLELPSAIQRALGNDGHASFQRWRKARHNRIPSAKHGAPIPVPGSDCSLQAINGKLCLDVKLTPEGRHRFLVVAGKGQQWATARAIASGEIPHSALKLVYSTRDRKWFAKVTYSVAAPSPSERCDPNEVLILHRGWYNFLFLLSTTGQTERISGQRLIAQKARLRARRRDVKRIGRHERGSGAKGHGRKRYYDLPDRLEALEANTVKTTCQQHAARVAKLAQMWGCGCVAIENYGGMPESDARRVRQDVPHPPYYQLKTAIEHALKKAGLELKTYDCYYISQTCPRCGNTDERQANHHRGIFRCNRCEYERDLEFVAAWHALIAVNGSPGPIWTERHESQRRAGRLFTSQRDGKINDQEATEEAPSRNPDEAARPQGRRGSRQNSVPSVPRRGRK